MLGTRTLAERMPCIVSGAHPAFTTIAIESMNPSDKTIFAISFLGEKRGGGGGGGQFRLKSDVEGSPSLAVTAIVHHPLSMFCLGLIRGRRNEGTGNAPGHELDVSAVWAPTTYQCVDAAFLPAARIPELDAYKHGEYIRAGGHRPT